MAADLQRADAALRALVDEYRGRCLWFLAPGYYPASTTEQLRVLDSIQRRGDLDGFKRAGEMKQWLLAHSSGASVDS